MKRPVISITMGDPAGVGPEITAKALSRPDVTCFRYHGVELSGRTGIFFEPVGGEGE